MFQLLIKKIQEQFDKMVASGKLFTTNIDGDILWEVYIKSFKPGDDPIFRHPESTTHTCSNDRHFIRNYGNIVAIINDKIVTIWDLNLEESNIYFSPCLALSNTVKNSIINNVFIMSFNFLHNTNYEKTNKNQTHYRLGREKECVSYTEDKTFNNVEANKPYEFWFFHIYLPKQFVDFSNKSIESITGELRTTRQLFEKTLSIPLETLELVRDLIQQGSLLRGDMYLNKVLEVIKLKKQYDQVQNKELWLWNNFQSIPFARFANELIGTTCIELAEGKEINTVCKDFNIRVDPTNYNKAKVPVTKAMIELAEKQIQELGYIESFERRFATIDDINVNEIKHSNYDNTIEKPVGLFGKAGVPTNNQFNRHKRAEFDKVETVTIDKFMSDILPNVQSLEVFLENRMEGNLVSLFTEQKPCKNLFKWNNPFNWTYNGNLSGKSQLAQMVEAKGGRTDGAFRFTHSWNRLEPNQSLMDLHVFMPGCEIPNQSNNHPQVTGRRVGWNKRTDPASGGVQDVDYVNEAPVGYIPVENITFPDINKMPEGVYECYIHNWSFRKTGGRGEAQIAFNGEEYNYVYPATKNHQWVHVASVTLKNKQFSIQHHLPETSTSRKIWNLETNQFHKVNLVCTSPNYWGDNNIGTKEYIFMLQDCKTDKPMRAFHVDQLNSELMSIRKAIDLLGNYKMVEPANKQLSGIGFNSTVRDELIVKVKGSHQRVLKITF